MLYLYPHVWSKKNCYPLVNVYIANWKITMLLMGKSIYKWPFSTATLNYQRVCVVCSSIPWESFQWLDSNSKDWWPSRDCVSKSSPWHTTVISTLVSCESGVFPGNLTTALIWAIKHKWYTPVVKWKSVTSAVVSPGFGVSLLSSRVWPN